MNKWSHLPNAKHIDWVIQSLKDNPDTWEEALAEAWDSTSDAARDTARDTAWDTAWTKMRIEAWNSPNFATRGAILAFVAYDDCERYINMSYEQLLIWSELDPHPACVLLLPYVYVKEKTKSKEVENV